MYEHKIVNIHQLLQCPLELCVWAGYEDVSVHGYCGLVRFMITKVPIVQASVSKIVFAQP